MEKVEYKHSALTGEIIGAAMLVHSSLGNGFFEAVYQRALTIEFLERKLPFEREIEHPLYYKGHNIGSRRADFLVDKKVIVELKAVSKIEDVHVSQVLNYLRAYELEVGLLINFGSRSLEFRRYANDSPTRPQSRH